MLAGMVDKIVGTGGAWDGATDKEELGRGGAVEEEALEDMMVRRKKGALGRLRFYKRPSRITCAVTTAFNSLK